MRFTALPVGRQIVLKADDAVAIVVPECGARLARFDVAGKPVLRPAPTSLEGVPPYAYAGFPLIPYSGPIFGGGFSFQSNRYGLSRNVSAEADATHGDGWIRPWARTAQSASSITLAMDFVPARGSFPFAWHAELTYTLSRTALDIAMVLTNRDIRPMPAGFGYHPYFHRPEGSTLEFSHGRVWPPDSPDAVAKGPGKAAAGLDFSHGTSLDGLVADRCYDDWNGIATLTTPDRHVRLTATPSFGKLQLYVPWYDPYVCIEPVSNANDGFNRAALGVAGHDVVTLNPGETLEGSLRIETEDRNTA